MKIESMFYPVELGGIQLRNRIIRAATAEGMFDEEGYPTKELDLLYSKLAQGGVGAIITGYIAVSEEGKVPGRKMGSLDNDKKIHSFKRIVDHVHSYGCPIIAQLVHGGYSSETGKPVNLKNLTLTDFNRVKKDFIAAAERAFDAGFDGIEIHMAHGFFLSRVISPLTNNRIGLYGGSEEGRHTYPIELVSSLKMKLRGYPIWVKISGTEMGKGIHSGESRRFAAELEEAGVSLIEVSCNQSGQGMGPVHGKVPVDMILAENPSFREKPALIKAILKPIIKSKLKPESPEKLYNLGTASFIKKNVNIPICVCGGIKDKIDIEDALKRVDLVSLSRPLIIEPNLVSKYEKGTADTSKCIGCNHCLIGIMNRGLRCYFGQIPKGKND